MDLHPARSVSITHACEHNLRSASVEFPRNRLIVVTGVSGSGKSSLIFDVLYREAENRYLGSFSSFARQFMGKMRRPDVERIDGISPAVALNQNSVVSNPRSTVGTITGIYDALRLLFARLGKPPAENAPFPINRSLFSFNTPEGACPACKGIGIEDYLDPDLLIADENKTLRQGALAITAPNGYIIYSQVTLDVLDQVCRAEGFHIDIPWIELSPEQKRIVLYGSDKIGIPYGKHPLESRMKWTGITAKPREMGFYKGIIPVMEAILTRDRNKNILRFVRSGVCKVCNGRRLNENALSVKVHGYGIADLAAFDLDELHARISQIKFSAHEMTVAGPVIRQISGVVEILNRLGLSYLSADRVSTTLTGGESRRLRLAAQAGIGLSGMICIFDEPSVGLHQHETGRLIEVLREIRDKGNTVIVVEHDEEFIRQADWLIDIGPGPGIRGGNILFSGTPAEALALSDTEKRKSRTLSFLSGIEQIPVPLKPRAGDGFITIEGAAARNLKEIDVRFMLRALNVVTGVSGAGKSTLTNHILGAFLKNKLHHANENAGKFREIKGWDGVGKLISIDQSPIGRTPRSNPATYTGLFDHIRDLFARQQEAANRMYDKSRFSFNTRGGRCESCEGAGYQQIGMHFMGNVEVLCEACEGRRFDDKTLEITCDGKNISEILEMTVSEALEFFKGEPKILKYLETLEILGLEYLSLGQRSSTLSGGEAQRIRLATELARPAAEHTLYIMNEPTTGLHQADTGTLLKALGRIIDKGHTVILIEHHPAIIAAADHIVDLGPGSGRNGGSLLFSGTPEELVNCEGSLTAKTLRMYLKSGNEWKIPAEVPGSETVNQNSITLKGVSTHNLKGIDANIPHNQITVITGVSGSGKSSLAFDTIFSEGRNRFLESFSPYVRARIGIKEGAEFETIGGLTPTFAVDQAIHGQNPRSTVGTITGIYDHYRLMYSRIGMEEIETSLSPKIIRHAPRVTRHISPPSSLFSFNHQLGACPECDGLGNQTVCDVQKLITDPQRSLLAGAMDGTKTGRFYGDPDGQHVAVLQAVGEKHGVDFSIPWDLLAPKGKSLAFNGTGEEKYDVIWRFKRDKRSGQHHFTGSWKGLGPLVNEEYRRKHADHRGEDMLPLMKTLSCTGCSGSRLRKEALAYTIKGKSIAELSSLPVTEAIEFFRSPEHWSDSAIEQEIAGPVVREIMRKLEFLSGIGLPYLSVDRSGSSLSGGEAGRVRLAGQLGSGLTGITYVLDEPTIGLHPKDISRLMLKIRELQNAGNTVVIVEHDREVIMEADYIIDLGPGAGIHGGKIIAEGTPADIMKHPGSLTGRYLRKMTPVKVSQRRQLAPGIYIRRATMNNLKGFDLEIPSGGLVLITGVSGSGKSSLVFDLIYASRQQGIPVGCETISGFENFKKIIAIESKPAFSGYGSVVATSSGIFDFVRDHFAGSAMAHAAGKTRNHFSFLNPAGQCTDCNGAGVIRTSMDFLPDVFTVCEKCQGRRYDEEILGVRVNGKNIADILEMNVDDAGAWFSGHRKITEVLSVLSTLGLGYLTLGQPLKSLSGGEVQRLGLASDLVSPLNGSTLYLFDEPSTGLHFQDIEKLMVVFNKLADKGHTLVIIEHDPAMIAQADHIIELGPEGGARGGYIVSVSPAVK